MTKQIRVPSGSLKASALILVIGLTGFGAPQESAQSAEVPKDSSRTIVAPDANEPGAAKPTAPPGATGASAATPAPNRNAKAPAAADAASPGSGKPGKASDKAVDRGAPGDYKIGAGDVLRIDVFHEPDATVPQAVVRSDGRISLPFLKEVPVEGLTPTELEEKLTEGLSQFLPAPDVTVVVVAINSRKIYIMGAVRHEGPLSLTRPMNVLQALAEAGGPSDFAKKKSIYVLRKKDGKENKLPFNYDAALKGEHMELNVLLMPDDIIVVPGSQ